jgi:zinc-finger of acetyl-transferase ESCO
MTSRANNTKRPRQQRRQSSPSVPAPSFVLSSCSVMEVDENRRQTSIQDYFFVKKSKNAVATRGAAGDKDRSGSSDNVCNMPLRSFNLNAPGIRNQVQANPGGLPKAAEDAFERRSVKGDDICMNHHGEAKGDVLGSRGKASAKRQYQQLFLDFGQRDFAEQQFCALCGMMVVHGVEEDIRQHEKVCSDYKFGVPFHSDTARAVAHPRPDSVIYQVR